MTVLYSEEIKKDTIMAISATSLQHNMMAMNAGRMYGINSKSIGKTTEKLSSGYRINRAADDAAGLAISEKMRYQIRGLNRGAENIQDGIGLAQVADGALAEVDSLLHRMNELTVQAANGTLTDEDRGYIQAEVDQITSEINRIGATTSFNDIHIFDRETIEGQIGKITSLISSPSAKAGYPIESTQINGKYYQTASIDFSKITEKNVNQLNGGYFLFDCPYGCGEKFKIGFTTDGTPSNLVNHGNVHDYTIDIRGAASGSDVIAAMLGYMTANPASATGTSFLDGTGLTGIGVSHRSAIVQDGNVLKVISNSPHSSAAAAESYSLGSSNGRINMSSLTSIMTPEPVYTIPIQCSSNVQDVEYVKTRMMNGEVLCVDPLNVSTQEAAQNSIDNIKNGLAYVANLRSELGAQQNRLEHAYNTNLNTAENETAAESKIRDTDMAKEMVQFSLQNILSQAGQSMMAQANKVPEGVLSLLQ